MAGRGDNRVPQGVENYRPASEKGNKIMNETTMDEIERLKAERKRIDDRLKELSVQKLEHQRWRIEIVGTSATKKYRLAFRCKSFNDRKTMWKALLFSEDERTITEEIPSIIEELQGLYELAERRKEEREG